MIYSMFVYHFVDPDQKVKILFEKEGVAENGGVDFEIGNIGTSAHLYYRLKKILYRANLLSYCFYGSKEIELKSSFGLYFHPFFNEFF